MAEGIHIANITEPIYSREHVENVGFYKIIGLGGDYLIIDAVYGHQFMARENISRALAHKVDMGVMDVEWAVEIAERFLFGNPAELDGI